MVKATRDLELVWGNIRLNGLRTLVSDLTHLHENIGLSVCLGDLGHL